MKRLLFLALVAAVAWFGWKQLPTLLERRPAHEAVIRNNTGTGLTRIRLVVDGQTFVMEALPPSLRARSASLITLVWNCGWAFSATASGIIIQRFGYHVPFYITAVLYGTAATIFYRAFRGAPEAAPRPGPETIESRRGEGPLTE